MTLHAAAASRVVPQVRATGRSPLRWWLALAALFAAAILLRQVLAANTDVSWLLTASGRVLAGERLYVDVIETNPPMAVLVYMPGIVIARALGLRAEVVTDALVFAGILASLAVVVRILKTSAVLHKVQGWPLAVLGFAVLAILPMQSFGQREHIALIALLPMLAVMAVRAGGEMPSRGAVLAAGIGAGVALSFKPHFAIGLACGIGALAIYARSWRSLLVAENFIAAALAAIYLAGVIVLFPEFFTTIGPLVRDVYLAAGLSPLALLGKPATALGAVALLAAYLLKRRGGIDAITVLLLATSVGFAAAFYLQRKGWPYHSYPMLALALLALGYAVAAPTTRNSRAVTLGGILLLLALFARALPWFDTAFDARPLQAAVARLGPHPVILAISGEPGIGHPLVRAVGGRWVSRQQAIWVASYLEYLRRDGPLGPARDAVLDGHAARERAMLIDDIHKRPPTVLLVDDLTGDGTAWLKAHPEVAGELQGFREVERINNVGIFARRD